MIRTTYENGVATNKPDNKAERACYDVLRAKGWTVTKRGWPDFFCFRNDEICLVEVKPKAERRLKPNQHVILKRLAAAGIKCFKWSPDGGMELIQ